MSDLERLVQLLSKLPGLGPRSGRRAALALLKRRETLLEPLAAALAAAARNVRACSECGNLDTADPCSICADARRDPGLLCVVEDVADLWAIERTRSFAGRYHVLGGTLSAIDGVGPEEAPDPEAGRARPRRPRGGDRAQRDRRGADDGALRRRAPRRNRRQRHALGARGPGRRRGSTTSTRGRSPPLSRRAGRSEQRRRPCRPRPGVPRREGRRNPAPAPRRVPLSSPGATVEIPRRRVAP